MKGYKDEDFIKLRNNALLAVAVVGLIAIVIILVFVRGFGSGPVTKKMKHKDTFVVFIENNKCSNCSKIEEFLNDNNVKYEKLNEYDNEAKSIFKKYDFVTDEAISPAIIYIKDGVVYSSLVNLNDTEELSLFIDNYELSK